MMNINSLTERFMRRRTDPIAMRLLGIDITVHDLSFAHHSLVQIGIRFRTMTIYIAHVFYYSLKAAII